jgi:hypothetical protein
MGDFKAYATSTAAPLDVREQQARLLDFATDDQLIKEVARRDLRAKAIHECAKRLTDEQLRREMERRGLWTPTPARFTDKELRDEGDRRTVGFWYGPPAAEVIRRLEADKAKLQKYTDEAKAAAQDAGRVAGQPLVDFIRSLGRPNDEWKRRAEAAEAKLADIEVRVAPGAHVATSEAGWFKRHGWLAECGPSAVESVSGRTADGHFVDPWDFLEDE